MAKVCILTAGKGSRLGSKTSFFNKGLIRVGDKAIISHIIDYFPEDYEFVIVTGYLGDIVKQYVTLAHPNRKVTFVEQKTLNGPGGALLTCQEFLQEPFYIWCADTLIDDFKIDESNNWIGTSIQKKLTDTGYSCMSFNDKTKVTCFHEKNDKCRTNAPYVGVSFVKNPHHFWNYMKDADCIVDGEIQVSTGFRGLDFLAKNFLLWIDAGSEQGLCCARDYFEARIENLDKLDEEIYFLGNRVVKNIQNTKNIPQKQYCVLQI